MMMNKQENDIISRQALIRWIETECNPYGKPTIDYKSGIKVIKHLERIPSAQPERKKGEWNKIHWKAYRCSECEGASEYQFNFCPNCGADMRGE